MIFIKNKTKILFLVLIIISLTIIFNNAKEVHHNSIAVYLDNIESTSIPDKNSNYVIDKIICDNDAIGTWDNVNWSLLITNLSKRSNCKLYFKSKKDITITYDNNYVKNNIFEEKYNTSYINISTYCPESDTSFLKRTIVEEKDYKIFTFKASAVDCSTDGPYFSNKSNLVDNTTHYFTFEAKASDNVIAHIGSEQNGSNNFNITTKWQKFSYEFTTSYITDQEWKKAFEVYWWLPKSGTRTLEIRDIQLQINTYDNYSATSLKEYDTLNNTLPTPTRDNYTFLGWYTDPIEGEKVSSETIATEDTTYYAHWQYNE